MYTAAIMKTELEASKGTRKLDMRIDNIQLVNVFTREIYPASIGIYNERIVAVGRVETEADQVIDGAGAYAVPGLIDSHIHIETTLLTPEALGEVIIPWGTTTLCVDAMEIANVAGIDGLLAMIKDSEKLPFRLLLEIPSRVPTAPGLETTGGVLGVEEVTQLLELDEAVSLGELDPSKVLGMKEEYLEKVEEKIQIKLENSISDETYADLQNVKKNKAKIFDLEQLLQKIEIEIDNEEKSEESLLPGYNMLITRIKEKLRPVAEEISMQLKEKDFEYYYERFYDKNLELFFEINKEELCEKRKYINGIRHNFYIAEMNKKNKEIEILTSRIDKLEKVVEKLKEYSEALKQGIKEYKKKIISDIEPLLHVYTAKILQQKFNGKSIYISTNEAVDSIQFVNSMKDRQDILYSMSSGQLSAVAISFLLCMNQVYGKHNPCSVLLIDDPVQTIDDVNMVGLVDLLRYEFEDRQIFISTHEQTFEWFLRYRYSKANKAVKIFNMKEIMLNEE